MADGVRIELMDCENTLLREIEDRSMKQRDIAQTYRLAMQSSEAHSINWSRVNIAIVKRWSSSGLQRIKEQAWSGRCFREKGDELPERRAS